MAPNKGPKFEVKENVKCAKGVGIVADSAEWSDGRFRYRILFPGGKWSWQHEKDLVSADAKKDEPKGKTPADEKGKSGK